MAEYLAAGVQAAAFDVDQWLVQLRNPAERSLALFVIARIDAGRRARIIEDLLARATGAIEAGYVVADGAPLPPPVVTRVIDQLFDQMRSGHVLITDCVRVAITLAGRPDVMVKLRQICDDRSASGWLRMQVADKLYGVDRELSLSALRQLVREPGVEDQVRNWAANRLAGHGDPIGQLYSSHRWGPGVPAVMAARHGRRSRPTSCPAHR